MTFVAYDTDFTDPEFDEEAKLVLESIAFQNGISFESSNETINIEMSNSDSVFGTFDDILEGNAQNPIDESASNEADSSGYGENSSDDDEKSRMASIYDEGNTITLEQYNKIKEGMTYQQVVDIVGSEGSLTANSSAGGISIEMYTWVGDGSYAVAEIGFQNEKVVSMTQIGLE